MARRVIKTAQKPFELKPQTETKWICMCGLSKNQPCCDKSHKKTADEKTDTLYEYDEKGNRKEVWEECDCAKDCCTGECSCGERKK